MTSTSLIGHKISYEKAKIMVTSILSFSHNVFKILHFQDHENQGLFNKVLTLSLVFKCLQYKSFENTAGKGTRGP